MSTVMELQTDAVLMSEVESLETGQKQMPWRVVSAQHQSELQQLRAENQRLQEALGRSNQGRDDSEALAKEWRAKYDELQRLMTKNPATPAEEIDWEDLDSEVSRRLCMHRWESNAERAFVWALVERIGRLSGAIQTLKNHPCVVDDRTCSTHGDYSGDECFGVIRKAIEALP